MIQRLRAIHFILLIGLGLRLLSCYEMSKNNPLFDLPIVDAKEYVDDATFYNEVNWLGGGGSYFHPPGYSYFIGLIFLFFGKSLVAIRLVQIGMDVVNIYLLFLIAQKIFDTRTGLLSALLYAVYVRSIQYSIEILPPVFVIFLLLASIYYLVHIHQTSEGENGIVRLSLSAFLLGLLVITLPNFLLAIPVFLLWIMFLPSFSPKKKVIWVSAFLLLSLFPTFSTALRNRLVADEGLLISRNGGINFFIGNNPDIKKTVGATPGIEWDKLLMLPYHTERITDFQEQDNFFNRKAVEYVLNDPAGWLKLMCKKTLWYFNAYEFPRNFDVCHFAGYSFVTKYPLFNLSILMPLALAGMALCLLQVFRKYKTGPPPGPGTDTLVHANSLFLIGIIAVYSFSIILVFIAARYRLPVIPLMVLFASVFLIHMYELIKQKKTQELILPILFLGLFAFITQQKFFFEEYPHKVSPVFTNMLIANTLINAGERTEGKKYLDKAVQDLPVDASTDDVYFELGHYYRGANEKEKAKKCFYKSVELDPTHYKSWNSLGFDLKMEGDFPEAIRCLKKGIEIAPCFPELYQNLADCYLVRKKTDSALVVLESYYQKCPSPHPNISESLAKIYMDIVGDHAKAAKYYEETIVYPQGFDPTSEIYNRLGACRFRLGEYKKAKEAWEKGLEIDPSNKAIRTNIEHAQTQVPGWNAL